MSDSYCYDDSDVLINRFGITDPMCLDITERGLSELYAKEILNRRNITVNGWGLNTLSRIHKALFGDVYPWAGHVRTIGIGKDGLGFCDVQDIKPALSEMKNDIESLPERKGLGEFVRDIAAIHAVLNSVHPFREGNGRTMRTFLTLYARSKGYDLDYGLYPKEMQLAADRSALSEDADSSALAVMYASITSPYEGRQRITVVRGASVKEPLIGERKREAYRER